MKFTITFVCVVFSSVLFGQRDYATSQFWNNQTHINPAFAGLEYRIQAGALYHDQLRGDSHDPKEIFSFYNMRLGKNWGVGLNADYGTSYFNRSFNISIPVSYRLQLNEKNTIAIGAAAAFGNHYINTSNFPTWSFNDPNYFTSSGQSLFAHAGVAYDNSWLTGSFSVRNAEVVELKTGNFIDFQPTFLSMLRFKIPFGGRSSFFNSSKLMLEAMHTYQDGFQYIHLNARLLIRENANFFAGYQFATGTVIGFGWDFYKIIRASYAAKLHRNALSNNPARVTHEFSFVYQLPLQD